MAGSSEAEQTTTPCTVSTPQTAKSSGHTRLDTDGYFTTGSAVAYGMVYEMNKDGYLYAFDVETGDLVWKYKGPSDTLLWPGMPTVADGKIYVTTGEVAQYGGQVGISEFACLNAYTGQLIWKLAYRSLGSKRIRRHSIWQLIPHSRQRNNSSRLHFRKRVQLR